MSKKNIIILIIAIIIFIGALSVFLYAEFFNNTNKSNTSNKVSQQTEEEPTFYFYDDEKNIINFNTFSDKPIVMLFWKSDDAKSYDIISLLEQYNEQYKDKIHIFAVNVNEPELDLEIVQNVKAAQFEIPMYFDTDLTSKEEYKYNALPYLIFIDKDGNIVKEVEKVITEDELLANLDLLSNNF